MKGSVIKDSFIKLFQEQFKVEDPRLEACGCAIAQYLKLADTFYYARQLREIAIDRLKGVLEGVSEQDRIAFFTKLQKEIQKLPMHSARMDQHLKRLQSGVLEKSDNKDSREEGVGNDKSYIQYTHNRGHVLVSYEYMRKELDRALNQALAIPDADYDLSNLELIYDTLKSKIGDSKADGIVPTSEEYVKIQNQVIAFAKAIDEGRSVAQVKAAVDQAEAGLQKEPEIRKAQEVKAKEAERHGDQQQQIQEKEEEQEEPKNNDMIAHEQQKKPLPVRYSTSSVLAVCSCITFTALACSASSENSRYFATAAIASCGVAVGALCNNGMSLAKSVFTATASVVFAAVTTAAIMQVVNYFAHHDVSSNIDAGMRL